MLRNTRIIVVILPQQTYKFLSKYIIPRHQVVKIAERRSDKPRHAATRDYREPHTTNDGYNLTNIHHYTSQTKKSQRIKRHVTT
jgi:hypothetical protein